jgi:CheY-like chemotaxis protein
VTGKKNSAQQTAVYGLFRGVYSRVARQLGVDRSYVSRVAQGQRRSEVVEQALRAELRRIEKELKSLDTHAAVENREGKKHSVLIVDDEQSIANTIALILDEHGFDTRVAYGGREAIRHVLEDCPDTVLTDVSMPYMNGIEAAKAIHEMCPDTRIFLFSGQTTTTDLLKTVRAQGYAFELLPKPIDPNVLIDKLRQIEAGASIY